VIVTFQQKWGGIFSVLFTERYKEIIEKFFGM